jgi:flagellar biosynthesis/type III secretory pathway protein FliH
MNAPTNLTRRNFFATAIAVAATALPFVAAEATPNFYADGFRKGKILGRSHGYEDGYKDAYKASYEDEIINGAGFTATKLHPDYIQGYKQGYAKGYAIGFHAGVREGSQDGSEDAQGMKDDLRAKMKDCMESGSCT